MNKLPCHHYPVTLYSPFTISDERTHRYKIMDNAR